MGLTDPNTTPAKSSPDTSPTMPVISAPKRKLLTPLLIGALIVGISLAGWYALQVHQPPAKPSNQGYNGPISDVTIGNIGEYSILNLIAKDRGYFASHGLRATLKEYASGPPAVADLLAGKVDFAVAADFVGVNNIFTHKNLRILAQVGQQDNFRLLALTAKGIKNPIDLKGKKIAVTQKSAGEFFLLRFLSLHSLKATDVTEVNATPTEMISQLSSGQVDAVVIFEPHVYSLQQSLGHSLKKLMS